MVCKVRLRFAKRGKLRFTSHRDVARAFERALRRAGLPMAYSQGFNPHPKVSWVGAAPTGVASEAEYLEIQLVEHLDPEVVRGKLDAALPEGLAVLEGVLAGPGGLAERIEASAWRIEVRGLSVEQLRQGAHALLAAPTALVERITSQGGATREEVRRATAKPKAGRPKHFTFAYRPPTKQFNLKLSFNKARVQKDEIISALEAILQELRESQD